MYSDSDEHNLVQSINRRILFAVSIVLLKEKPEHISYHEYCQQLRIETINKLEENDPYGILVENRKQTIFEGLRELIVPFSQSVNKSQNENSASTTFDSQTLFDYHKDLEEPNEARGYQNSRTSEINSHSHHVDHENLHKQTEVFSYCQHDKTQSQNYSKDLGSNQDKESMEFDSGIQQDNSMQTPLLFSTELQERFQQKENLKIQFSDQEGPLITRQITSDIELLNKLLRLKSLMKERHEIPSQAVMDIVQPGSTCDDQDLTISTYLLESKIEWNRIIPDLYNGILEYIQENLFSKLREDKTILMEYKGSNMEKQINKFLEIINTPKCYEKLLTIFVRKQMLEFYFKCTVETDQEVLEQLGHLLLKFCRTTTTLECTIDFIVTSIDNLSANLQALASPQDIVNEENATLFTQLLNSPYLFTLARRCARRLSLARHDKKQMKQWRDRLKKAICEMKDYRILLAIEGSDLLKVF